MAVRVGINGFGRIGRQALKALLDRHPDDVEVVAINDLFDTATNAHLFKYDSNYGVYPGEVEAREKSFVVNGREIHVTAERDPAAIPWKKFGAQIVIESTGLFTDATKAKGARRRWRRKSHHLGARPKRRHHHRPGRQSGSLRSGQAHHHFECLVHDQWSGARRQGAVRPLRHPARPADHRSTRTRTPSVCSTSPPPTCATRALPR